MKEMFLRDYENIAILQTAFLGDVALTIPLTDKIREINPHSQITFITTVQSAGFVQYARSIDQVISYDKRDSDKGYKGMKNIAAKLKNFDLLLIPHRSARSSLVGLMSGVTLRIGFDSSSLSFLHSKRVHRNDHDHEISKNLSLLLPFSDFIVENVPKLKSQFHFDENDIHYVEDLTSKNISFSDRIVAIFPGSVWETKRWIPSHFSHLISSLEAEGFQVVLMGSSSEKDLCGQIANGNKALNLAGKMSIPQSLIFVEKCSLVITNDSAPTHFAGLMGVPVLTIFGPTSPIFGFSPVGDNSAIVEVKELKCRPCEIHGSKRCPINTHECMVKIDAGDVFKIAIELLNPK